jgi:hypothetical protein
LSFVARVVDIIKQKKKPPETWEELGALLRNTYRQSEFEVRLCNSRRLKALFEMLKAAPTLMGKEGEDHEPDLNGDGAFGT